MPKLIPMVAATLNCLWMKWRAKPSAAIPFQKTITPGHARKMPDGKPIATKLKKIFQQQRQAVLEWLNDPYGKDIGDNLPDHFINLDDWDEALAKACKPIIELYFRESSKKFIERIGASPDLFSIVTPHISDAVSTLTLTFSQETNETTSRQLSQALADLREEIRQGLIETGTTRRQLTERVNKVFDQAEEWRAERIAVTEASRSIHKAESITANESGVVKGKKWLASADACPECLRIASEHKNGIPLDQDFAATESKVPEYQSVPFPPAHPHCQCTVTYIVDEAALKPGMII